MDQGITLKLDRTDLVTLGLISVCLALLLFDLRVDRLERIVEGRAVGGGDD